MNKMPIQLQDLTQSTPVQVYSPKFFDSKLTGAGKKIVAATLDKPLVISPILDILSLLPNPVA